MNAPNIDIPLRFRGYNEYCRICVYRANDSLAVPCCFCNKILTDHRQNNTHYKNNFISLLSKQEPEEEDFY